MRLYREILNFLLIREQLSLGWKIGFFVICAALVYGALTLRHITIQSIDLSGTVVNDRTDVKAGASVAYLTVQLDSGDTVRASSAGKIDYRPGQRVLVKEKSTTFLVSESTNSRNISMNAVGSDENPNAFAPADILTYELSTACSRDVHKSTSVCSCNWETRYLAGWR